MKNEIKKIKDELAGYVKNLDEDIYLHSYAFSSGAKKSEMSSERAGRAAAKRVDSSVLSGKKDRLAALQDEVSSCRKCLLGLARIKPVFGAGDPEARVVFIGEGPGYQEDRTGEPFVGRAGQLLDKILAAIDLSREKVYIANIVKCHPMINPETPDAHGNDRPPTPSEISLCRHYIEEQLRIIRPACVVTLGNVATKFMLNETRGITLLRGKFYEPPLNFTFDFEMKVLPTYHPAALLRNPNLKKDAWEDMKALKAFLEKK